MIFSLSPSAHQSACAWKQKERQSKIDSLPAEYSTPLSLTERKIHSLSLSQLVSQCLSGQITPLAIMMAFAKKSLVAQSATNCLTDIMFEDALLTPAVVNWGPGVDSDSSMQEKGPIPSLMGVPVSIKDTVNIKGYDTVVGYSRNVGHPSPTCSSIVRLLQDAGALIHVKTTVPIGLISLETVSDVFGRTSNPYSKDHTAGASTGGGAALLACGGSKIEIGTDIGGSVRIPAHFCGIWSLKGSAGRFPSWGSITSMPGLEGVPIITAPMATNLADLREFWERVINLEPWNYDHTCIPLPWKDINLRDEGRKLKWGVIWEDGAISPSPACRRALGNVVSALKQQGHEVVDFQPPNIFEGLKIGYQLVFSDGGDQLMSGLSPSESLNPSGKAIVDLLKLPKFIKRILSYFTSTNDSVASQLYLIMHKKTVLEDRDNIARRDAYRAEWHKKWIDDGLDFVLTVPHSLPAFQHGGSQKVSLMSAGYTFIFSILDYTAGVLPVTFVNKNLDALPHNFLTSDTYQAYSSAAKDAYSMYNPDAMHGLPLGVQVVGRRLEEEKVLEGMQVVECALKEMGIVFASQVKP